jgi:hypothetical protein
MKTIAVAVVALSVSITGLAVVEHYSHAQKAVAQTPSAEIRKKPENVMDGAYSDHQKAVAKEQGDTAKKDQWAKDAQDFKTTSGHCPTEKECE